MNCLAEILALTPPPANGQPGQQQNPLMAFLPMILLVVVFYFILIRPQQKRAKEQAKMVAAIKAGDKVVTAAGLIGTILTVKDKSVTIRSADAKFEVTKASVVEVIEAGTDSSATAA